MRYPIYFNGLYSFISLCNPSWLTNWYLSVVLIYLWSVMYCTMYKTSCFSHRAMTLCRICFMPFTFGFRSFTPTIKWNRLFLKQLHPFMPVNNLLSNSLKFGFAAFLPGQEIFSLLVRFQALRITKRKAASVWLFSFWDRGTGKNQRGRT